MTRPVSKQAHDQEKKTYREELPETLRIQPLQCTHKLLYQFRPHTHPGQLPRPEILDILGSRLRVDSSLQRARFGEDLFRLRVFGIECRRRRERPAERREPRDHELAETRESWLHGMRGAVGAVRGDVGPAPACGHAAEDREGHFGCREVVDVFCEMLDCGYEGFEDGLVSCSVSETPQKIDGLTLADDDGAEVVGQHSKEEVEILSFQLGELNLIVCTSDRIRNTGENSL